MSLIDYSQYRSVLCLNGSLPEKDFFNIKLPLLAADGAANTLLKMGVKPNLIIGDLDSIDLTLCEDIPKLCENNQNFCDFEKAMAYLAKNNLLPCIILGINGGYLDHILNNINLFLGTNNICYAPPIIAFTMNSKTIKVLDIPVNTKISIIGIPDAEMSSTGLKWELNKYPLSFPGKTSCFNRVEQSPITLVNSKGSALVLIYEPT